MNPKFFWLITAILLGLCESAGAQQHSQIPRVGFLSGRPTPTATTPDPNAEAFRQGLRELGYIEGKNILLELRYSEGKQELAANHAAQLVQEKVDVIVTPVTQAMITAKKATSTIPIVVISLTDPVATGLASSLAHPGGNVTGLTRLTRDLSGKRLEIFKEAVPAFTRVGVLLDPDRPVSMIAIKEYESAARLLKIQLQLLRVRQSDLNFDDAFKAARKGQVTALVTVSSPRFLGNRTDIATLSLKNKLPSMFEGGEYVDAGGLMSYATNDADSFRRAAIYVDKL